MKLALLGMAMMGTATFGTTDLFHKAQDVSGQVTAVYSAAADINHFADQDTIKVQQERLYDMAARLEPFAQEYGQADPDDIEALLRQAVAQTNTVIK